VWGRARSCSAKEPKHEESGFTDFSYNRPREACVWACGGARTCMGRVVSQTSLRNGSESGVCGRVGGLAAAPPRGASTRRVGAQTSHRPDPRGVWACGGAHTCKLRPPAVKGAKHGETEWIHRLLVARGREPRRCDYRGACSLCELRRGLNQLSRGLAWAST